MSAKYGVVVVVVVFTEFFCCYPRCFCNVAAAVSVVDIDRNSYITLKY